ncbi:putative Dol-P-Glc:Glc(2)Man(9)GlcNAc(2)-PP-Dol alpha-1,2-glucosyltransferase isoform X1 [Asterias rubens]|uniref:putative Dol-P-Glc:Glc(2)Man(9)GlcNAc(2)-PP-Dol alpha-1,2-glucosyltransferase isoform X1 n=2 Tax=Asterias rubens TaxID=7604 RepID=UPI001454F8D3|nr:putative Dol-P-Glc:Glc(2)Man(9)GlcNAc(2)-PP-Dol alpha-1,2-glucosyltransferase isoform X1 [Asterias rubens]
MAAPMNVVLAVVLSMFLAFTSVLFYHVNKVQPQPYMDEIFHVPQAKKYCNGSFNEWDPMITTLPGLYLASVGLLRPITELMLVDMSEVCTTTVLRSTNVLFAVGNLYMLYALIVRLHKHDKASQTYKPLLTAASLAHLPVLYFFSFLYYTDPGSTFFILIMYLFSLHGNHLMAGIMGVLCVIFRQSNIVWVVFTAGVTFVKEVEGERSEQQSPDAPNDIQTILASIKKSLLYILKLSNLGHLILVLWPYGIVAFVFMAFLVVNKGIVLGDKSNHEPCLNVPQLFYFMIFTAVFALPYVLSPYSAIRFLKACLRRPFANLALTCLGLLAVHYLTYVHIYVLSDNRHYVSSIWRLYQRHDLIKYAIVPFVVYMNWCMQDSLSRHSSLWKLVYFICVAVVTVPQRLLELRYFIVPYLMFRIHMPLQSYWKICLELLLGAVVNSVTLYLYMERPFFWEGTPGLQRYMW